jgi:hypothetical protein
LAEIEERRAKQTACPEPVEGSEEIVAEEAEHQAALQRTREVRARPALPVPSEGAPELVERFETPISPRTGRPLKRYKKRRPKPPFTPPDQDRKAEAAAAVEAERRELADAEAERRRRRKDAGDRKDSGDGYS